MNLSLHHFKKEALNIRGRWALWLMLLGIDLAIQLEWLMPMTHREFNHFAPDSAHFLVMIAAVVVAVSGCPEDQPSRSNAFIATRPLSRASYYAARVLLIVLMLVAPLVLQEALYLKLSHRPWRDVAQGVAWRAIVAGAWLAWVLPGMAVWKGWVQTLLGAGVFLGVLWLSEKLASNWFTTGGVARESITYSLQAQVLAAWLGAAVMLVLAWLHNRGRWPLARRLAATAALSPLFYLAMQAVDARSKDWRAEAPARVAELAKSIQVTVPQERLRPILKGTYQTRPATVFMGRVEMTKLPPGVEMIPHVTRVQATQGGRFLRSHLTQDDAQASAFKWEPQFHPEPIVSALPPGTMVIPTPALITNGGGDPLEYDLGRVETEPGGPGAEPWVLRCDFDCDWYEWKTAADVPLQPGSEVHTDDLEMRILRVLADTEGKIQAKEGSRQGAASLRFHTLQRRDDSTPYLVLYAPDKRTAWCLGRDPYRLARRAVETHWQRALCIEDAQHVLSHMDGAKACDMSRLRLIVLQRRYLGHSQCAWQSPPMNMQAPVPGARDWYYENGFVETGKAYQMLRERLDSLTPPGPQASSSELNRYVLDVLTAFQSLKTDTVWREQRDLAVERLRPFASQHLDVLLALSPSAVPDEQSPVVTLVTELSTEAQRDFIVERILACDWLAIVVQAKGWGDYARQKMLPAILARGRVEQHLRTLMLTWNDTAVKRHQLEELRVYPDARTFAKLYEVPALRPELDRLADTLWSAIAPVRGWENISSEPLEIAVSQGRREALDLALRWSTWAGDTSSPSASARKLAVATARQTGMNKPKAGDPRLFQQFRSTTANQFEYQPARRAWRLKP